MFKLAIAQSPAELDGPKARMAWLGQILQNADLTHLDMVVLPELFLSGYNIAEKVADYCEEADGPMAEKLRQLAIKHRIALHYGFPEARDGKIYNSAQCFDENGERLTLHRKLILPPGHEADYFTQAGDVSFFEFKGFKVSTLICYDSEFPENFRRLSLQGADVVIVPTALAQEWGFVARTMIPTRAFENGVYVAYANHCGTENGLTFLGGSCLIAPDGEEIFRAEDEPAFLTGEITRSKLEAARKRLPYLSDLGRFL